MTLAKRAVTEKAAIARDEGNEAAEDGSHEGGASRHSEESGRGDGGSDCIESPASRRIRNHEQFAAKGFEGMLPRAVGKVRRLEKLCKSALGAEPSYLPLSLGSSQGPPKLKPALEQQQEQIESIASSCFKANLADSSSVIHPPEPWLQAPGAVKKSAEIAAP